MRIRLLVPTLLVALLAAFPVQRLLGDLLGSRATGPSTAWNVGTTLDLAAPPRYAVNKPAGSAIGGPS